MLTVTATNSSISVQNQIRYDEINTGSLVDYGGTRSVAVCRHNASTGAFVSEAVAFEYPATDGLMRVAEIGGY